MNQCIDFDTHIYDNLDIWEKYVDPKLRDRLPFWKTEENGRLLMILDGKTYPTVPGHPGFARLYGPKPDVDHSGNDPHVRLKYMDGDGAADVHVIFPTLGLAGFPGSVDDPTLSAGLSRAYNRYLGEYTSVDRRRLVGAMLLPANHPEQAAAEMRWAVQNTGMKIVALPPTPPGDLPWSHDSRDIFWQTANELGVKVIFHETTTGAMTNAVGIHRDRTHYPMVYLCTHVLEVQLAFADMILGGTLERFPNLKVGAAEAHVHWLPGWLSLLDQQFGAGTKIWSAQSGEFMLKHLPSEYFRRQCYLAAFPKDTMIREAYDVAPGSITICTDYPHPVAAVYGQSKGLPGVAENKTLTPQIAQRILYDNPMRFMA